MVVIMKEIMNRDKLKLPEPRPYYNFCRLCTFAFVGSFFHKTKNYILQLFYYRGE